MELHPVHDRVIVDRPGVCSASTKSLDVGLPGPSKILIRDRRERQQLDLVDLDHDGAASVDASDLDLRSRPEAVRDGDGSVRDSIAKVRAELHAAIVSSGADAEPAMWDGAARKRLTPSDGVRTIDVPMARIRIAERTLQGRSLSSFGALACTPGHFLEYEDQPGRRELANAGRPVMCW